MKYVPGLKMMVNSGLEKIILEFFHVIFFCFLPLHMLKFGWVKQMRKHWKGNATSFIFFPNANVALYTTHIAILVMALSIV